MYWTGNAPRLALIGALVALVSPSVPASPAGPAAETSAVTLTYTADLLRNAQGGLATGNAFLDLLDVEIELDGASLFGLPGLKLFAHAHHTNEAVFSELYSGDAQVVSNIDATRGSRIMEAWAEFARSAHSIRIGLYDLNSEFDSSEHRSLFVNSAFGIGHELSQSGSAGPSIFPLTGLAVRYATTLRPGWDLQFAALEGTPGDPDRSRSTPIRSRAMRALC